ncbi:MAG: Asp-tRNA(Asn)/Glu-tRNA(Gln) amidotransferase subunit GatB [Luminiphilus sp.]
MKWEMVMGLEVHLQLATQSKIFSSSKTAFGAPPNEQTNPLDVALPGTLPVLNEAAVRQAIVFGLGVGATINKVSRFDRKNYFYPDLPKGYQISQFFAPIVSDGVFDIPLEDGSVFPVRILRAHLEEDAGKSVHDAIPNQTAVDLNRAGTPLLEVVTEPDFRTAEQVVAYLKALHGLVTYLGISDGNMAEGSMRCDVNISLRPAGTSELGTRTELKNLNSFKFIERAIQVEAERQQDLLEDDKAVTQETRLFDPDLDETRSMRSKEVANDYRYFPDPDLLPVVIDDSVIDEIRGQLPELPAIKRERYQTQLGLSAYDASLLTQDRASADYFEASLEHHDNAKALANWMLGDLAAAMNRDEVSIDDVAVTPEQLALLVSRIDDGTLSSKMAKTVFEGLWHNEGDVDTIIEARGLKQVSDTGELEAMVDELIANSPEQVAQYRAAEPDKQKKLIGYFVGQAMKASKGQANPQVINEILRNKL